MGALWYNITQVASHARRDKRQTPISVGRASPVTGSSRTCPIYKAPAGRHVYSIRETSYVNGQSRDLEDTLSTACFV